MKGNTSPVVPVVVMPVVRSAKVAPPLVDLRMERPVVSA
jgi:hypothetical protein